MFKFLTLLLILLFAWWRFRRWWRVRLARARGEPLPPEAGVRPITLLSLALLGGYGGFLLWHLFARG